MAISEKRRISNKKWDDANKERVSYLKKRSAANSFIKIADYEDLQILKQYINKGKKGIYFMKNIISFKKDECMEILEDYLEDCVIDIITNTKRCALDIMTHTERVVKICKKIIKHLDIDKHTRKIIYRAAIFHDIAKLTEDSELKNHNVLPGELLDAYFESDEDLEMILSIIKYHNGKFEPDKKIAVAASILRMADKIDKFNKKDKKAEKKYKDNLEVIKGCFEKNGIEGFEEFEKACDKVKKEIIEDNE